MESAALDADIREISRVATSQSYSYLTQFAATDPEFETADSYLPSASGGTIQNSSSWFDDRRNRKDPDNNHQNEWALKQSHSTSQNLGPNCGHLALMRALTKILLQLSQMNVCSRDYMHTSGSKARSHLCEFTRHYLELEMIHLDLSWLSREQFLDHWSASVCKLVYAARERLREFSFLHRSEKSPKLHPNDSWLHRCQGILYESMSQILIPIRRKVVEALKGLPASKNFILRWSGSFLFTGPGDKQAIPRTKMLPQYQIRYRMNAIAEF